MNQKKLKTSKKLPTALSTEALKQVKGGFREMPDTINSSLSVRWDEIIIRFHGGKEAKGLGANRPSTTSSVTDSGMEGIMP
jgi:hypothetical protein